MDNQKFGNFIKKLRKEKGLTQKELGEKLNITDKAISKWERGLSFPDITMLKSLADFFEVDVSELLNGEKGIKEKTDVEVLIKEAIEKYKNIEEKRKKRAKKIKRVLGIILKVIGIIFLIIFLISGLIQTGYLLILKRHNFEYIIDITSYIINEIIIISAIISFDILVPKLKKSKIIATLVCIFLAIINAMYAWNNGSNNNYVISFSSDFSNELVLKIDKDSGAIKLYRDAKIFLFAKEKEQLEYEINGDIKKQWLTNDICALTYMDKDNKLREYVVTYGDRGNGRSYYYVTNAIYGNWQVFAQYGNPTQLLADSKGITITKNNKKELFEYSNCEQFGTIALVLYKNDEPKYVIALDENCELDDSTGIIKKGGNIEVLEVSMEKTQIESLYCMTYKDSNDMSNYNLVSVGKNEYKIQDGIMYISYDGENVIEVPGEFSQMKDLYNEYNYQISEDKTIFYYVKDNKRYLVYSDDMGQNWNTVEIENKSSIENIHFINSDTGYMLLFDDVAVGVAWGKIAKTVDGGRTWNNIYYGVGSEEKTFSRASKIKFINEEIGFLTMPFDSERQCEIYITRDGGYNFEKLELVNSEIYDYYNLPTVEDNILYLKISQGADGDYNGGDTVVYYSKDCGENWDLQQ